MNRLTIYLFGSPHLLINEEPVELNRCKALALLAYLAVTNQPQSRDTLATLFWPDKDQTKARAALRKALFMLNQSIGKEWLQSDREVIGLNTAAAINLDVAQFKELLQEVASHKHLENSVCSTCMTQLDKAADLYTDRFMAGFTLPDSVEFDHWQQAQSDQLHQDVVAILAQLVDGYQAQGETEKAIATAQHWLQLDSLDERVHRQLMILYRQNDQLPAAVTQYETCQQILADELGVPPSPETQRLFNRILEGPPKPSDLPPQPTEFIGRDEDLHQLNNLLAKPHQRLITIVGLGGIGKTRLSLAAAASQSRLFADGVFFVSLASLDSATLLVPTIAATLNLYLEGRTPQKELLRFLQDKQLLLVLDSFEHLIDGVALLSAILTAAPEVKLLITSHQQLNLHGEVIIDLPGLEYPLELRPDRPLDSYSAIQLFLACAERLQIGYQFTPADQKGALRLCQLVEGSPLGIELAATWLRVLSCTEIAQEVERSLTFLAATLHDVPERHHSMQAVIAHSWNLLLPEEQEALQKLSVFRGGFNREAATQIGGISLFTLSGLIHKSLLRRGAKDRYELHELVRQFASIKLQSDRQNEQAVRTRHCQYYAHLMEEQKTQLLGREQRKSLLAIEVEMDNIRQAWCYAVDNKLMVEIIQMHISLFLVHEARSWFLQGEELFGYASHHLVAHDVPDHCAKEQVLGITHHMQGVFCQRLGFYDRARELLDTGLSFLRHAGGPDKYSLPVCLYDLGLVAYVQGDYPLAKKYFEETLTIFNQHPSHWINQWMRTHVLSSLGSVAFALGDYKKAERLGQECLHQRQEMGDHRGIALSLNFLGSLAHRTGHNRQAQQYCQQSLEIARQMGSRRSVAKALNTLGQIALDSDNLAEARRCYEQSLALFQEIGDRRRVAYTLGNLSQLFLTSGQHDQALKAVQEALYLAHDTQALPALLKVMVDAAHLLFFYHQTKLANTVLVGLLNHPASGHLTKDNAARLLVDFSEQQLQDSHTTPLTIQHINVIFDEIQLAFERIYKQEEFVSKGGRIDE